MHRTIDSLLRLLGAAIVLPAILGAASCTKSGSLPAAGSGTAEVTVRFNPSDATKVSDTSSREGETSVASADILVFRSGTGALDVRHRATGAELSSLSARIEVVPGLKRIFVVANAPESLTEGVTDEAGLLSRTSSFSDNAYGSFLMVGAHRGDIELTSGAGSSNAVSVELRRLAARVKVERIEGAFTSPALAAEGLRIRRVFLSNVPASARAFNGGCADVFGTPYARPVPDGELSGYYDYALPGAGDLLNRGVPATGKEVVVDAPADLTAKVFADGEGVLYGAGALPDNAWVPEGGLFLYTYPNGNEPAGEPGVHDLTTKLVVEAETGGETCWYPIVLPYTQPNWAYTVNRISLTRRGSDDPDLPVWSAQCSFTVTVTDWATGEIVGSYNRPDGLGGFIM